MATSTSSPKSVTCKGALCYIWLTLVLLLVAIIIFAVSTTEKMVMYAGVICMMLSALSGSMYFIKLYCEKYYMDDNFDISCCCANSCPCFKKLTNSAFCVKFIKALLCIENNNRPRGRSNSSSTSSSSALSFTMEISSNISLYDRSDSHTIPNTSSRTRHSTAIATILQAFQHELQLLYQEYSHIQVDANRVNDVLADYKRMDYESNQLKTWIQNQTVPSEEELNKLRHSLAIIQQNIYVAKTGKNRQSSMTADMASGLANKPSTSVHQLMLYTTQMAEPPPYNEQDPLNTSNTSNTDVPLLPPAEPYQEQQSTSTLDNNHNQRTESSNQEIESMQHNQDSSSSISNHHQQHQHIENQHNQNHSFSSNQQLQSQQNQTNVIPPQYIPNPTIRSPAYTASIIQPNNCNIYIGDDNNNVGLNQNNSLSSQLSSSLGSLAPPADDSNAPPSYTDSI